MGFKEFGLFFLLLSVQLYPLPAVPQTSLSNPLMTIDLKQEQNVTYNGVPKTPSESEKLADKQNIRAVNKLRGGGSGGGRVVGGGRGGRGGARGGRVVPIYAAGGTSHPRNSHSHGSVNYVSLHCLIWAFSASFFIL